MAARAAFAIALALVACTAFAETTTTSNNVAESRQQPLQKQNVVFDVDKYPETKQLREPSSYLNRLFAEEYTKRAAMRGFQGMRGKKSDDLLEDDYYYEKRAPMGFEVIRGKKAMDYDDADFDKRAPMGFQGMRGKKSLEEMIDELEKRTMRFHGTRGKKSKEYEEDLPELEPYYEEDEWHKRAPMGFQGMRGRKSFADDMEKRAMQLGFHGTRGKKSGAYEQQDEMMVPLVADDGDMEKRPMMMGFHGMRGKRSANYYEADGPGRYLDKRSPYRFFGTRGKKNPRWELRGKFVGVRGKKWSQPPPRLDVLAKQLAASYDDDDDTWH